MFIFCLHLTLLS